MKFFSSKILINLFFIFIIFYLTYHILIGRYTLQNYFINKFELKLFQDFHYNLKQKSLAVDMDLKALYYQYDDFMDELSKQNVLSDSGDILIKLD